MYEATGATSDATTYRYPKGQIYNQVGLVCFAAAFAAMAILGRSTQPSSDVRVGVIRVLCAILAVAMLVCMVRIARTRIVISDTSVTVQRPLRRIHVPVGIAEQFRFARSFSRLTNAVALQTSSGPSIRSSLLTPNGKLDHRQNEVIRKLVDTMNSELLRRKAHSSESQVTESS